MTYSALNDGRVLHLIGPNPGTQYTRCGVDAGLMSRVEIEEDVCATWCYDCLVRDAAGHKLDP